MELPRWAKIAFALIAFILATVGGLWLAGFVFVALGKANPIGQTDFTTFYSYWYYYGSDPVIAKRLTMAAVIAAVAVYVLPVVAVIAANRQSRALHGAARFASAAEIYKSPLMAENGIIVGKYKRKYLVFGGQQFVMLAAPTRSGKGVGNVIPNLLNFPDSVMVLDLKQENFNITSGFRAKHGQDIYLFNPFAEDYRTSRYNPLDYVRDGDFRVGDLTAIGEVFYPSGGKEAFFDDQARNLFVGLGLYLCETPDLPRTIGEMLRQSSGQGQPISDYLTSLIQERNYLPDDDGNYTLPREWDGTGLRPLSQECMMALNQFIATSDNTRSSILASFNAPLGIWTNPIVDAATSASDFDLRDVRRKRMSIYIGITPDYLGQASRIINLLFSQLINLNTKVLPQNDSSLKYSCLLLMDEFTAMGFVKIIGRSVTYFSGYNLRLLTIIQSPSQLEAPVPDGYGKEGAKTIMTNHACQILYAPKEQADAETYSKMLGDETVKSTSVSKQSGRGGTGESISDQRRALMLPQEIKEIGQWKEIVILENMKPILAEKIRYFADPTFIDRLKSVSPSLAKVRGIPSKKQLDAAVEAMELAAPAQNLDMDTHRAKIEARIRPMTTADVGENGEIDLRKIALDLSSIPLPDPASEEELKAALDGFFNMLDVDDDGTNTRASAAEIAALDELPDEGEDDSTADTPASVPAEFIGMVSDGAMSDDDFSVLSMDADYAALTQDFDDSPPLDLSVLEGYDGGIDLSLLDTTVTKIA